MLVTSGHVVSHHRQGFLTHFPEQSLKKQNKTKKNPRLLEITFSESLGTFLENKIDINIH